MESCQAALCDAPFKPLSRSERWVFGTALNDDDINRAQQQTLFLRIGWDFLPVCVLGCFGRVGHTDPAPLVAPIPSYVQERIASQTALPVSSLACSVWYRLLCTAYFGRGCIEGLKTVARAIGQGHRLSQANATVLCKFGAKLLPRDEEELANHLTLGTWIHRKLRPSYVPIYHQQLEVRGGPNPFEYSRDILPPLVAAKNILIYCAWLTRAFLLIPIGLFFNKDRVALLFYDAVLAMQAQLAPADAFAARYVFTSSNLPFRPLWTHIAEDAGSEIVVANYSTNQEGFRRANGDPAPKTEYSALNWPVVMCWDEHQRAFLERVIDYPTRYPVVDYVWLNDSGAAAPTFYEPAIAYFDVQPFRDGVYGTFGVSFDYYVPGTAIAALSDTLQSADDVGAKLVYKRKREIGKHLSPRFARYLESLNESPTLVSVDPEMAAQRLVERADAVVSMPWTSTALIARHLGTPSCYYDPTGKLQPDDPGAHGIPVLQTPQQLQSWLKDAIARRQK